jgi:ABC-type nitrate/sulfonate/bicarbonate transport system substrate-binding protein
MTPDDLEAVFDKTVDLVNAWTQAEDWADNCPASERDDARGVADTAKDEVLQYLSHVAAATSPEHAALQAAVRTVPAGYFVAPDAYRDIWIWRDRGNYPVAVVPNRQFVDDPELWDYLACALPHRSGGDHD